MNRSGTPTSSIDVRDTRQHLDLLPGGSREHDPPLTVRALSSWTGLYSPKTIRRAIHRGELRAIHGRGPGGRPFYRLELADAIAWLKLRGYTPDRVAILERVLDRQTAAQECGVLRTDRVPRDSGSAA